MHFYDFNIGDYAKKTPHLTNDEDLAYRRLLDIYYDTEKPIAFPLDNDGLATLSRRLRLPLQSVKNVLDEFFPNGKNKHADEKISDYYAFLAKQSENGKKGGRPKNHIVANSFESGNNPPLNDGIPTDNPPPSQPLTTNHLPLTKESNTLVITDKSVSDRVPYEAIVNLYHKKLPTLPKVVMLTAKRRGQIGARWKSGVLPDIETWGEFFTMVSDSQWLMGKIDPPEGRKRFVADLEWITNESNFTKIWEGKYHGSR